MTQGSLVSKVKAVANNAPYTSKWEIIPAHIRVWQLQAFGVKEFVVDRLGKRWDSRWQHPKVTCFSYDHSWQARVWSLKAEMSCGSSVGGTSIEDLAEKFPDKIIKIPVDIFEGITDEQANKMVEGLQVKGDKAKAAEQIKALYKTFTDSDCTMVEVNPTPIAPARPSKCRTLLLWHYCKCALLPLETKTFSRTSHLEAPKAL